MDSNLLERTLLISLQTADTDSESDLLEYLGSTGAHAFFLNALRDEALSGAGRALAIAVVFKSIQRGPPLGWHADAKDIVHKLAQLENSEIASAAVKYATDVKILVVALDHKSIEVRRIAAKRLRQVLAEK